MNRLLKTTRWTLPLGLALAGGAIGLRGGSIDTTFAFTLLLGASIGVVLHLLLRSTALLVGHATKSAAPSDRRLQQLEADKQLVLRSIREIEFDATLQKLSPEEAAELTEPLRQRALRLLRELDEATVDGNASVDAQIEREVERRLRTATAGATRPAEQDATTPAQDAG